MMSFSDSSGASTLFPNIVQCAKFCQQPRNMVLQRMRLLVENVKEMVAARMPDNSLQMLFTGFRLPSPLGESFKDLARPELADLRKKTRDSLETILQKGKLDVKDCMKEILRMLPCAEAYHTRLGLGVRQSWARASVDFKELKHGRAAISLYLSFQPAEGDVERRLKDVSWHEQKNRAHMLGSTMESLVLAMQAPSASQISKTQAGQIVATTPYLPNVLRRYVQLYGAPRKLKRAAKVRRDSGQKRKHQDGGADGSEAGFLRRRHAAVENMSAASSSDRQSWLAEAGVPAPDREVLDSLKTQKFVTVRQKIAKVAARTQAKINAEPDSKKQPGKVNLCRWAPKPRSMEAVRPGFALVPELYDLSSDLVRKIQFHGFQVPWQ